METNKNHNHSDPIRQRILSIRSYMIYRCTNPSHRNYRYYGGRGIKICDEWLNDKESFYKWAINNGYKEGLQIDRIDTNGDYEPSNCRWTTSKQNCNNRRNNKHYTINNESHTIMEWCEIYNVPYNTVYYRVLSLHWDIYRALTEPSHRMRVTTTINGVTKPIYQWAKERGIPKSTLYNRLKRGYSIEEALKKENFRTNGNGTKHRLDGKRNVLIKEENKDPE